MKKIILLAFTLAANSLLMAQQERKTSKLKLDEVPLSIRTAFENDFGKIPEDGWWSVNFVVLKEAGRTTAKPLSYILSKRSKTEKIEVRYSPEGKLEFVKGLDKINGHAVDSPST